MTFSLSSWDDISIDQRHVAARVQALTRTHQVDILVTDALRAELDTRFVLTPMPAEVVKGIAEPVITYAVREALDEPRGPAIGAGTSGATIE